MYRVLVVDDEKLERDGIRFLLSMEEGEWEIYEAANGKLALNELRKHPVDLMLTDIKMPHMDGLELSKKAREEYPDLEIIIFSGYGDFAFAQEAIRYGVTDYVLNRWIRTAFMTPYRRSRRRSHPGKIKSSSP